MHKHDHDGIEMWNFTEFQDKEDLFEEEFSEFNSENRKKEFRLERKNDYQKPDFLSFEC